MSVNNIGKPLDITPVITKTNVSTPVTIVTKDSKNVVNNTNQTKIDSVKINKETKLPTSKTNYEFVNVDTDKKTLKVGTDKNNLEMKLSENTNKSDITLKEAKFKLTPSDKTAFEGNLSGEFNKPSFNLKGQTDINGIKITSTVNNTITTNTNTKSTHKQNDSFDIGKTTGNIKTEIKPIKDLTITTESQIDTDKKSQFGGGAKLKVTDSVTAESSIKYDKEKTKISIRSEAKYDSNLKFVLEGEHEANKPSGKQLTKTSKAVLKTEITPYQNIKLIAGTNIDEKGNFSGNLRSEVKINSFTLSSGVETKEKLDKNVYDIKASGELFQGLKINSGVELKDNKPTLKAGISYSNSDDSLRFKADTTGKEHSIKIEGGFKF